jgi:hypothetical protein
MSEQVWCDAFGKELHVGDLVMVSSWKNDKRTSWDGKSGVIARVNKLYPVSSNWTPLIVLIDRVNERVPYSESAVILFSDEYRDVSYSHIRELFAAGSDR